MILKLSSQNKGSHYADKRENCSKVFIKKNWPTK